MTPQPGKLLTTLGTLPCTIFDGSQDELEQILALVLTHLLEPYSIYVYWYFLHTWPQYCYVLKEKTRVVGVVILKVEPHREVRMRGYIGMLVIDPSYRGRGLARDMVRLTVKNMIEWDQVDEVMLETEVDNDGALGLYEGMGFLRTKRLYRYYLNTRDAYRLILPLGEKLGVRIAFLDPLRKE